MPENSVQEEAPQIFMRRSLKEDVGPVSKMIAEHAQFLIQQYGLINISTLM